jgi:predicted transcriptional regulator of viral defense system
VFSTQDIRKWAPGFDNRRLVEWQQKGYIHRIINRWYTFARPVSPEDLLIISNRIYSPSYVSLQWALSHYRLIPEGVYTVTAITSLKTQDFTTTVGTFSYKHVKPSLMFGYRLITFQDLTYKLAEPEKLVLDYLYLNASINSPEDFAGLRLNISGLKSLLDMRKLRNYLALFKNSALETRVNILTEKFLNDA